MPSLVAEIAAHFPVRPVPSASDAIVDTYTVEHLHRILGDRPWPTLTPAECRHCEDGFVFLTPVGLHYYLPAYMTAELVDAEEADCVTDSLIGLFQGAGCFGGDRYFRFWRRLTPIQSALIGKWIDHYEAEYHFNDCTATEVENARSWLAEIGDHGETQDCG